MESADWLSEVRSAVLQGTMRSSVGKSGVNWWAKLTELINKTNQTCYRVASSLQARQEGMSARRT